MKLHSKVTNTLVILFVPPECISGGLECSWPLLLIHLVICSCRESCRESKHFWSKWQCRNAIWICIGKKNGGYLHMSSVSSPVAAGWLPDNCSSEYSSGSLHLIWAINFPLALSPFLITVSMRRRALSALILFSSRIQSFSPEFTMLSFKISSRSWLIICGDTLSTKLGLTRESSFAGRG